MARKIVDARAASKGPGRELQRAFDKVNDNFTELYAANGSNAYYAVDSGVTGVNDGSRDDTPLLQDAYAAAVAAGLNVLILPKGSVYLKTYTADASYPFSYVVRCAADDFTVVVPEGCVIHSTPVDDGQGGATASSYWSLFQFTGDRSGITGGGAFIHDTPGYTGATPNNYCCVCHHTASSDDGFQTNLSAEGFTPCIGVFDNSSNTKGLQARLRVRNCQYGVVNSAASTSGMMLDCWVTDHKADALAFAGENFYAANLKANNPTYTTGTGLHISGPCRGIVVDGVQISSTGTYNSAGSRKGIIVSGSGSAAGAPIVISNYLIYGVEYAIEVNGCLSTQIFTAGSVYKTKWLFNKNAAYGYHSVDTFVNGLIVGTIGYGFLQNATASAVTEGLWYLDGNIRVTGINNSLVITTNSIVPNGYVYPPIPIANRYDVQRVVPAAGDTVTATVGVEGLTLLLVPAGTLATLTVVFPTSMVSGQTFRLRSTQVVTTLTVTGTVAGSPAALTAGYDRTFIYDGTAATWV